MEFRTAVDCAQAASDAAPRMTTSNWTMFRARAGEIEHASIAKYEFLERSMEDMWHSPISCPQPKGWTVAGRDQARHHPVDFIRVWLLRNNLPQRLCHADVLPLRGVVLPTLDVFEC